MRGGGTEGFSAWWWLGLPVASLVTMSLLGQWAPGLYQDHVDGEQGVLEMAQAAAMAAATVVGTRLLLRPELRRRPALFAWAMLATACSAYVAGEELSWGQHLFDWSTPEGWRAINDQGETNLHNTSSWLDQKPRALLETGVIVGGIVLPLAALRLPTIRGGRFGIVVPPMLCLPSAVLAEATRLVERLGDGFGLDAGNLLIRPAEYQELYFYVFILFYLIVLAQRTRRMAR